MGYTNRCAVAAVDGGFEPWRQKKEGPKKPQTENNAHAVCSKPNWRNLVAHQPQLLPAHPLGCTTTSSGLSQEA
jgi:hypothetical protein